MRQRIRDVAAMRNLSEQDIKYILRLKHRDFMPFCNQHGVNVDWLLTGEGRMFNEAPPSIA